MRLADIDKDIAVAVLCTRALDADLLVPAMGTAYWVGLDRKDQVLMNAGVFPPDAFRIRIGAREAPHAMDLAHQPLAWRNLTQIHQRSRPFFTANLFVQPPSAQVMRTRDN